MHWPQETQLVSPSPISKADVIAVLKPRLLAPITPMPCVSLHTATQRRHKIHLLLSRIIWAAESSISESVFAPSYFASFSTPYCLHRACSSQLPLRTQLRQERLWLDSISSSVVRRAASTRGVFVHTSMPSLMGYTQAVTSVFAPLTSTTQIRQAPISLISFI